MQQDTANVTTSINFCAFDPYSQDAYDLTTQPVADPPKAETYHTIFREVMAAFHEKSATAGGLHVSSTKDKVEVGHASHVGNAWIVKATLSDYVCDVVLCVRPRPTSCLHPEYPAPECTQGTLCAACDDKLTPRLTLKEFTYFKKAYVESYNDRGCLPLTIFDARMRKKAVARFIYAGVYPMSRYFRAVDVRDGKSNAPVFEVQSAA